MNEFYDVHVGNLSVAISHQNLRDLFGKAGEIVSTWIYKRPHQKFTYGFVKFRYLDDARNASKNFNNTNLDGLIIKVDLSNKTKQKLTQTVKKRDGSLLLELPKRTRRKEVTKRDIGDKILRDQIVKTNDKNFVSDFVSALKEMDDISCKPCEIIKTEPGETNLQTLEDIVLRYYKPVRQKKKIEIDIDLSNNKVLESAVNAKFFNIAF